MLAAFGWFVGYLLFLAFLKSVGLPTPFFVIVAIWVGFAVVDTISSSGGGSRHRAPKAPPRPWAQALREDWKAVTFILGSLAILAVMVLSRVGFWPTLGVGTVLGVVPALSVRPTEGVSRALAAAACGICGAFYVLVFYGFAVVASAVASTK